MGDILIRDVDEWVLRRLKVRAKRNGRSLQAEVGWLLSKAMGYSITDGLEQARLWRAELGRQFDNSAALIREDRER